MPVMEMSVIPIGTRSASLSKYVAEIFEMIKKEKNIKYELTAMGTIIESESIDNLLRIVKKIHEIFFTIGVQRVVTTIKIDDRRDKQLTIKGKLNSVYNKIEPE